MRKFLSRWCKNDAPMLGTILLGAFLLRLFLAPLAAQDDTPAFRSWMESGTKLGIVDSYSQQVSSPWLPIYPPVIPYLLTASGHLYRLLISPSYTVIDPAHMVFAKLPAIVSDVAICLILFLLLRHIRHRALGLSAAAIYAVHPAAIYDSALWGQMDSVYTLFLLACIAAAVWGKHSLAVAAFVVACFTKPQALLFLPLLLFVVPYRPRELFRMILAAMCTTTVLLLPFLLKADITPVLNTFNVSAILGSSRISWNAYNFWWALLGNRAWEMPSTERVLSILHYRELALFLFGGFSLLALLLLRRTLRGQQGKERQLASLSIAAGFIALCFFTLGVEVHDRYLFPFIALALPVACLSGRFALLYTVVSIVFLLNLASVFPVGVFSLSFLTPSSPFTRFLAVCTSVFLILFAFELYRFSPLQRRGRVSRKHRKE